MIVKNGIHAAQIIATADTNLRWEVPLKRYNPATKTVRIEYIGYP